MLNDDATMGPFDPFGTNVRTAKTEGCVQIKIIVE